MTFISKNLTIKCIFKYDILNDSNIQMPIILSNVENIIVFNIYNEKNQKED